MTADYGMMEPALAFLAPYGPDLRNGLTSHGPMAAEALAALGRADAVMPWLQRYRKGLLPRPPERERIPRDAWQAFLGHADREADWEALFADELADAPWRDVLARWTARLTPGICANATHGVIRTGHAVRSLEHAVTPARLRELGDGLASWAANHQTLPTGTPTSGTLPARAAIERVNRVPMAERTFTGTIVSSLAGLANQPEFADAISLLDVRPAPAQVLSELTETFARVYLANAHDVLTTIVFVHGITSLAALRTIVPYLPDDSARTATQYAWQASAALYAAFAMAPARTGDIEPPRESADTLVDRAIANGDEHAIKLTEACLREHALAPSAAYLAAARHATELLVME
jgi:Questin oxidase-like